MTNQATQKFHVVGVGTKRGGQTWIDNAVILPIPLTQEVMAEVNSALRSAMNLDTLVIVNMIPLAE